jgi:hypothetical protein
MTYFPQITADKEVCAGEHAPGMLKAQDAIVFTLPWDSFEWPLDATVRRLSLTACNARGTGSRAHLFGKQLDPFSEDSSTAEFDDVAGRA